MTIYPTIQATTRAEAVQNLIAACNAKGLKFEYREAPAGSYQNDQIGFYLGKHVWHWFDIFDSGYVYFNHSYSCNTGEAKKGRRHGIKVWLSLAKRLELIF